MKSQVRHFVQELLSIVYDKGTPWVAFLKMRHEFLRSRIGKNPTASQLILLAMETHQLEILGEECDVGPEQLLLNAIEIDPFSASAYLALGEVQMTKNATEAVEMLKLAFDLQPTLECRLAIADALALTGRFSETHLVLKQVEELISDAQSRICNLRLATPEVDY